MRNLNRLYVIMLVSLPIRAMATVIEDFETDFSNYTITGGGANAITTSQSKHDGTMGAHFPSFGGYYYDLNIRTSAGHRYRAFVRQSLESNSGGLRIGVKATAVDTLVANLSVVDIGLGYSTYGQYVRLTEQPFFVVKNVWYQLELEWQSNGVMTINTYSENGVWLAGTRPFRTDELGSGGLHILGSGGWDMDTITETPVPEPATITLLSIGMTILATRRKCRVSHNQHTKNPADAS